MSLLYSVTRTSWCKTRALVTGLPWAEKYRPRTLDQVVGQAEAVDLLRSLVSRANPQSPRALLLIGPHGCGKSSLANAFVFEYFKTQAGAIDDDDKINGMLLMNLNGADSRGPDSMKQVDMFVSYSSPKEYGSKVVIIDSVDRVSYDSQVILSKAIQEHNAKAIFVMTSDSVLDLHPALLSTSFPVYLKPLQIPSIKNHLKFILKQEECSLGDIELDDIAQTSSCSMRDAINKLQLACLDQTSAKEIALEETIESEKPFLPTLELSREREVPKLMAYQKTLDSTVIERKIIAPDIPNEFLSINAPEGKCMRVKLRKRRGGSVEAYLLLSNYKPLLFVALEAILLGPSEEITATRGTWHVTQFRREYSRIVMHLANLREQHTVAKGDYLTVEKKDYSSVLVRI